MVSSSSVIEQLVNYVSRARTAELPHEVVRNAKHHILDTLAVRDLRPLLAIEARHVAGTRG